MEEVTKPPRSYQVLCISLYHDDVQQLDDVVSELKTRGLHRANRSALIRLALRELRARGLKEISELSRGMR